MNANAIPPMTAAINAIQKYAPPGMPALRLERAELIMIRPLVVPLVGLVASGAGVNAAACWPDGLGSTPIGVCLMKPDPVEGVERTREIGVGYPDEDSARFAPRSLRGLEAVSGDLLDSEACTSDVVLP